MGNTHNSEIARLEADFIKSKWRTTEDYRWGYAKERGPETWWIYYPSASGGNQSPVNIMTEEVHLVEIEDTCIAPLQIYYSSGGKLALPEERRLLYVNTGTTVQVWFTEANSFVEGGPCKEHGFSLQLLRLHWGENDNCGSEHLVNSRPYSAELHLIHWNAELYETYEEAAKKDGGILIISVFVTISKGLGNKTLEYLSTLTEDILYRDQSMFLPHDLDVSCLVPETQNYWTYRGSFTTPPCYETVTWVVFDQPITINRDSLDKFRQLRSYGESETRPMDEHDGCIMRNIRQIQPVGTRRLILVTAGVVVNQLQSSQEEEEEPAADKNQTTGGGHKRQHLYQWKE